MTAIPDPPGLQPERTALAWQRTAITATVIMVPLVLVNARLGSWLLTVLGSVAMAAAVVLAVQVRHRFAQLTDDPRPLSPYAPMVAVVAVTVLAAAFGLTTALLVVRS